jgi:hypothetical protein
MSDIITWSAWSGNSNYVVEQGLLIALQHGFILIMHGHHDHMEQLGWK